MPINDTESWDDSDFPDEIPISRPVLHSHDVEAEDWDFEIDLGPTGGAKPPVDTHLLGSVEPSRMFTIRPPITIDENENEDEGDLSTIKAGSTLKGAQSTSECAPFSGGDDDIEIDLDIPEAVVRLSLPLSSSRRVSRSSMEWAEKDQTSSSHSSSTYSNLFPDATPSSSSASSISQPCTESEYGSDSALVANSCPVTDAEEDDWDLDGLEIPDVFESRQAGSQMRRMLENKKQKLPTSPKRTKSPRVPAEDNFEDGLVIDQGDLSPSKLRNRTDSKNVRTLDRRRISSVRAVNRPSSRAQPDRAKSPLKRPPSTMRQFMHITLPPTPPSPPKKLARNQTSATTKAGALRSQKSQIVLKTPEPSKLARKGSLSSLTDVNQAAGLLTESTYTKPSGYNAPTLASRAKVQTATVKPAGIATRPITPSITASSVRMTMPTLTRTKSRTALTSVFPDFSGRPSSRNISPLPPLPARLPAVVSQPNTSLSKSLTKSSSTVPREMRKPKRQHIVADPSALDLIDDLPVDLQKEKRFRVQPKNHINRIPGGTFCNAVVAPRKKTAPPSPDSPRTYKLSQTVIRRTGTIIFPNAPSNQDSKPSRKPKTGSPTTHASTKRKPTLIRQLGAAQSQKVVGEMKWNPKTLRWEGNENALSAFEGPAAKSVRPALITQLTGSVIGSPMGRSTPGARRVGNMIFDPIRMCWLADTQEDEIDVFADFADDETDWSGHDSNLTAPSPAPTHERTISESSSDRGSRASLTYEVDATFSERCHAAEARHAVETHPWRYLPPAIEKLDHYSHLYDIRALATRQY